MAIKFIEEELLVRNLTHLHRVVGEDRMAVDCRVYAVFKELEDAMFILRLQSLQKRRIKIYSTIIVQKISQLQQ